jgi:hypothetical protein
VTQFTGSLESFEMMQRLWTLALDFGLDVHILEGGADTIAVQ